MIDVIARALAIKASKKTALIISSAGTVQVEGFAVPSLTAEQLTSAFNSVMTGWPVVISSKDGDLAFFIKQADTDGDNLFLEAVFYDKMILTYELDQSDVVTITGTKFNQ